VWEAQEPAVDVDHPGREALTARLGSDDLDGWFLLHATDERLSEARELDVVREGGDDTHEIVAVRDYGGENGWGSQQSITCTPQLALDGATPAEVWLDGEPEPDAQEVELLVVEMSCAGGESAEGRVRLVELHEREDAVEVVVGVRSGIAPRTCPSNPAMPFTVELREPLGDRTIIDASVYPPRPLDAAPIGLLQE
jgi:hypothetical protein